MTVKGRGAARVEPPFTAATPADPVFERWYSVTTNRLADIVGEAETLLAVYSHEWEAADKALLWLESRRSLPRGFSEPVNEACTALDSFRTAIANWPCRIGLLAALVEAELPDVYSRLKFVRRDVKLPAAGQIRMEGLLQELELIRDEARQRAPGISTNARPKQSEGAARQATNSPTLNASTATDDETNRYAALDKVKPADRKA